MERDLVEKAAHLSPEQLRRTARRALEVVEADPTVVDRHEDALLRTEEDAALAKTRLTLHDNGDGTTIGHFTVPTLAASVLRTIIHTMISPRRAHLGAPAAHAGDPQQRRDPALQAGLALVELLEHLPTDRLHHKVAATVVLHHRRPWSQGGTTNLADADPLCGFHHRRIHDPRYHHTRGPDGITFTLRR